jgi:hypothetical protein
MWNQARKTTSALSFTLAAAVSFLGGVLLLKAGRAFPVMGGGAPGGEPGILLIAVVILLATAGVLLLAMAGKEFVDSRRQPQAR